MSYMTLRHYQVTLAYRTRTSLSSRRTFRRLLRTLSPFLR